MLKEHWWLLCREQTAVGREVSRETSYKAKAGIWARDDGSLVYGVVVRMMKGGFERKTTRISRLDQECGMK